MLSYTIIYQYLNTRIYNHAIGNPYNIETLMIMEAYGTTLKRKIKL